MTPSRLDEITARLAQATPGPWHVIKARKRGSLHGEIRSHLGWIRMSDVEETANADLIAHAPDDLTYLLARLKAAEAVCEAEKKLIGLEMRTCYEVRKEDYDDLQAKITTWQGARDG